MSSHDEYSSDEEDLFDENQKSEVYLGFVDAPIITDAEDSDENDLPTIEDTFIGGTPVWFNPNSKPKDSQITCANCGKKMALLLQAFAPLDGKLYDRVIYIFGCKNTAQCSKNKGSIKCLRGVLKDPNRVSQLKQEQEELARKELDEKLKLENKKQFQIELTKDLFSNSSSNSNPFSSSTSNPFSSSNHDNPFASNSNPLGKFEANPASVSDTKNKKESYAEVSAKNLNKYKPPKSKSTISDYELPSYPGYFVYVDQEKFKKITLEPELEKYKHLIDIDVEKESSNSRKESSSSSTLNPQASKISSMLDDKYFEAFTNTVKHNPSQVLRYDLGGRPLLYNGRDIVASKFSSNNGEFNIPIPAYNPSSKRQFELQLMPKTIMDLEKKKDEELSIKDILNGMSWGTIIVCTDIEDYVPDEEFDENHVAYIEEWCGVQWEESV